MKKKLNDKQKLMAYVLNTDADLNANGRITQSKIGDLFEVSQPTVAQAIKDVRHKIEITNLQNELLEAKRALIEEQNNANFVDLDFPDSYSDEYKRLP